MIGFAIIVAASIASPLSLQQEGFTKKILKFGAYQRKEVRNTRTPRLSIDD
jgi:hypothetical protein